MDAIADDRGVQVSVTDIATGATERTLVRNNYLITTAGACEVTSVQHWANGTSTFTIKRGRAYQEWREQMGDGQ